MFYKKALMDISTNRELLGALVNAEASHHKLKSLFLETSPHQLFEVLKLGTGIPADRDVLKDLFFTQFSSLNLSRSVIPSILKCF